MAALSRELDRSSPFGIYWQEMMKEQGLLQKIKVLFFKAFKYGIVGLSNTALTLSIIFVLRRILGFNLFFANGCGYAAGLANSFFWNRRWTFKAHDQGVFRQLVLFLAMWGLSYGIQLGSLYILESSSPWSEEITTLLAMICFTGVNFILNNFVTFRGQEKSGFMEVHNE